MNLWDLSWQGGVLIGVILLLRVWGRYRLPGWTFRVLWGVALLRLLIPISLPTPWSVYNRLIPLADQSPLLSAPQQYAGFPPSAASSAAPLRPQVNLPAAVETVPAWGTEIPWLTILYLSGVLALAAVFLLTYLRCIRAFRAALPLDTPGLEQIRAQFPELRTVSIRQCDHIRSPLTYGLLRPVILLPRELDLSQEPEITYILLHEGSHVQNRDTWWKLFLSAALCLHWFNPLVWVMYRCANRDLERCCDEHVIRRCGLETRSAYALTLLKWEEERLCSHPLCSSFGTHRMKERVISIMKLKRRSAAALTLALVLIAGTTVAFATSPAPQEEMKSPVSQDLPSSSPDADPAPDRSAWTETPSVSEQLPDPAAQDTSPRLEDPDSLVQPDTQEPIQIPPEPLPESQGSASQLPAQTDPSLAEKYHIPEGYIEDGTLFTVANDAEYEELTKYLYGLDRDLNFKVYELPDNCRQLEVYRRSTASQDMQSEWLENGDYKRNKYGETYGSDLLESTVGYRPDLIAVIATDTRASGFVDGTLMNGFYGYPYVSNGSPDDVGKYMEWLKTQPPERYLPVYDVDHEQILGTFVMRNDQSEDYTPSQEDLEFEIQAVTEMMESHGYSDQEIQEYIQQLRSSYAR